MRKTHCWLARISPKKRKDRKIHGRIGGARWLGPENDGMIDAPNPPLGDS